MSTEKKDVLERAIDFATLSLPGQPMAMHMGTSYLVNDLASEVRKLRAVNTDLLTLARCYASECGECAGFRFEPNGEQCPSCSDVWSVIDKAEGRS